MVLQGIKSFWSLFASFILYRQMVVRLIWRAGLPADFAAVMAVEGLMRRDEVHCLYELAQHVSAQGVIVEIGSYRGLSTVALARGSLRGARAPVYTIDPHEHIDRSVWLGGTELWYDSQDHIAFLKNIFLSQVAEIVRPIHLHSEEAVAGWVRPISLLWIDGDHEYEAVKKDFVLWSRFLIPEGTVALHDSADPKGGPFRVVQEVLSGGSFELIGRVRNLSVLRRVEEKPGN